jgi:hypothetical protein
MVRYTVKAGRAAENERLIERVMEALATEAPAGLHYAAFRLEDGVTFVHVVSHDSGDVGDALREVPAFREFRAGLDERCEVKPVRTQLHEVGSYQFFGDRATALQHRHEVGA